MTKFFLGALIISFIYTGIIHFITVYFINKKNRK